VTDGCRTKPALGRRLARACRLVAAIDAHPQRAVALARRAGRLLAGADRRLARAGRRGSTCTSDVAARVTALRDATHALLDTYR
jgi:hypothetical protein